MNMSIRFFKAEDSQNFARLQLNELREAAPKIGGLSDFAFPPLSALSPMPQSEETESAEEPGKIDFSAKNTELEKLCTEAENRAAEIIAEAENRAAEIEKAAHESGLAAAQTAFAAEVETAVNELLTEVREQLVLTIHEVSSLYGTISRQAEADLVALALEIAKKIVRREVTLDREIALTLARVTLGKLNRHAVAKVHLHPEDFAYLEKRRENLDFHGALELVEDRSIDLGGCLIRTDAGDFDARIESQFDEISRGLLS
jgi:flagellar assembly protein FliH